MEVGSGDNWRVLVVEDDETVAAVHCRLMSQQPGFRVVGRAGTASEALRLIRTTQPDLVLLDLELPGPSGLSLLRQLRAAKWQTEVIVITAHAHSNLVRAGMQLGALDYLVKPFWPERLVEALGVFVGRVRSLRAGGALAQEEIDRVRSGADRAIRSASGNIRMERLRDVRATLENSEPMTADEVAEATGIARVTARRYLEHLVALGHCTVDAHSDGPGRPRKAYQLWLHGPIG